MAGDSNLYDIFDSPSQNTLSDENNAKHKNADTKTTSYSTMNTTTFDSMLEILPDSMDFSLFPAISASNSHSNSQEPMVESPKSTSVFPHLLNKKQHHTHTQIQGSFDSMFDHSSNPTTATTNETAHGINSKDHELNSGVQPIDIANQQNGEIAQLWDFNVDEFMMTPNNSNGSATITAPNSYNSELQFNTGSAPGVNLLSSIANNNQFGASISNGASNTNDYHQLLGMEISRNQSGSFYNQSSSSSPRNSSQITLKREESSSLHRPPLNGRRSSSQLNKMIHPENAALSSAATGNSIRKNSTAKQMSSTSLSNYKRASTSSSSDLPKKPPLQCTNCKTLKTPLWRRDSHGNTLCNACGLFQKLHGTMRPLSLKSDVIKKRNNKKRAKKNQAQTDAINTNNSSDGNFSSNFNTGAISNSTSRQQTTKNSRSKKKSTPINNGVNISFGNGAAENMNYHTLVGSNGEKTDISISESGPNVTYGGPHYQGGLNSNNLMTHNNTMSPVVSSNSNKSRRGSISSNNSSSSRSSSRSVVPILPKPSPGATTQTQFNFNMTTSNSSGNSAASSPRVAGPSFNPCSPMTSSQPSMFSSSTGRPGITIPRRKSSRNHSSSSSSFMAASLQQLQNQHQQSSNNNQTTVVSNSWNQNSAAASPKAIRSPKAGFDLFQTPSDTVNPSNDTSKKAHTSLLSQQLQNSGPHDDGHLLGVSSESKHSLNINTFHPQQNLTTSLRKASVTASPRNSYVDSLLHHRGINKDDSSLTLRRQTSYGPRRTTSFRDQASISHSDLVLNGNSTPPTPIGLENNTYEVNNSSSTSQTDIADELDWLKFGI